MDFHPKIRVVDHSDLTFAHKEYFIRQYNNPFFVVQGDLDCINIRLNIVWMAFVNFTGYTLKRSTCASIDLLIVIELLCKHLPFFIPFSKELPRINTARMFILFFRIETVLQGNSSCCVSRYLQNCSYKRNKCENRIYRD